jgi:protocatechuate 3,4-dioxygenase alpha subunit
VSPTRTPSQTVGPYYSIGLCRRVENELVPQDDPRAVRLAGRLLDGDGEPIADGMVEVWDPVLRLWGRSGTDAGGVFSFVVAQPGPDAAAPRLEVLVFARGLLRHQLTRIYFPGYGTDDVLTSLDPDERATLIAVEDGDGLRFDIRMQDIGKQGSRQTVFFRH